MSHRMRFAPLSSRHAQPRPSSALAASVLAHALFVAAVAWWYHPDGPTSAAPAPPAGQEVVFLDFPSLDAQPGAPSAGVSGTLPSPGRTSEAPRLPRTPAPPGAAPAPAAATPASGAPALSGAPAAPAATSSPAGAPSRPWSSTRDPRLYVPPRSAPPAPERPVQTRMNADIAAAIRADSIRAAEAARESLARRQITVFGRRVTVGGDSAAAGIRNESIEQRRGILTMPSDGRLWVQLQHNNQAAQQQRDSVFRARARATRERNDAARRGRP